LIQINSAEQIEAAWSSVCLVVCKASASCVCLSVTKLALIFT